MGTTALEANLQTLCKIVTHSKTDLCLKLLKFFAVFSGFSLNIDKLKTLNTAKI